MSCPSMVWTEISGTTPGVATQEPVHPTVLFSQLLLQTGIYSET